MLVKPAISKLKLAREYGRFLIKRPDLPKQRFIIFGNGRSGSTLLVNLLNSCDRIHCDGEILNRPPLPLPNLFIKTQAARSPKPVYGFKLLDYHLKDLQKIETPQKFLQTLHSQGWQFIYLIRQNKLHYALSILNALHRQGFHHREDEGNLVRKKLWVDIDRAMYWIRQGEENTQYYNRILQSIPHLKLTYEDNLSNAATHQDTADRVFDLLDLPRCEVESNLVKLMSAQAMQMVENKEDLVKALQKTKYARFLDTA